MNRKREKDSVRYEEELKRVSSKVTVMLIIWKSIHTNNRVPRPLTPPLPTSPSSPPRLFFFFYLFLLIRLFCWNSNVPFVIRTIENIIIRYTTDKRQTKKNSKSAKQNNKHANKQTNKIFFSPKKKRLKKLLKNRTPGEKIFFLGEGVGWGGLVVGEWGGGGEGDIN